MFVNNHNIYTESHGPEDGHPIVLLHHGLGSTRAWYKQIPSLTYAGYKVIVYDRWGYGQSEQRPYLDIPSFKDDLADLDAILEAYQLLLVTLIGHSDGGTIALYWAAQYPGKVSALVTIAPQLCAEQWRAFKSGDHAKAMEIHNKILPLVKCYSEKPFPGKVKELLNLQGRKVGKARRPILEPTMEEKAHMRTCLEKAGLI